jgi:peptidyl-prolyl cis-trans isomerase SurA
MKTHMKPLLLSALLLVAPPLLAQAPAKARLLDRVIAIINDDVITLSEFEQQKASVLANLKRQNVPTPNKEVLDKQVLERFINEKAELQQARENGIKIDEPSLEASLDLVAKNNSMSRDQLKTALEKDGVTWSRFREELRNDMTLRRLREREVDSRVNITESEIDNYLTTAKTQGAETEEYQLAHILVLMPEQANADLILQKEKRANEALAALKAGQSFSQVAAVFSDAGDAVTGGNLGWRASERLPNVFADVVKTLAVGDNSAVIKSPNGFHIVKLLEKRNNEKRTVIEQTRARHILVKVNDSVSEGDARQKIDRLAERIKAGENFAEIAKGNSEDFTNVKGGDLGWISGGDTVQSFEDAYKAMAIDEVSRPIRTPFGWHLIQVQERRQQDITNDRTRSQARNVLRERKAEEAYQDWLRQLRDKAFVEIKLED